MNLNKKSIIFFLIICFVFSSSLQAQIFTPIVGDYECGQFPDGAQYLVKKTTTGYALVKTSEVRAKFKKERKIIRQRISTINEVLKNFKKARISKAKLIKAGNKLATFLGTEKIPGEIPPDDAEVAVMNFKQMLLDRDAILQTIGQLINDCESGINPKTGKGNPIGVSVMPISLASSNTIYGGFMIHSAKIKGPYSSKPGGYNVCIKLVYPDGTVGKFYSGFGDDYLCGTGTLKFEGVPQSTCNALMPRGQVGYVIQKRVYNFVALPNATKEELLDRMRLEVLQDQPMVGVMAFPSNSNRDSSIKACNAF